MNVVKCEHWKCSNDATERRVDDELVFLAFDTCGQHDQGEWSHLLLTYPATATEDETMTDDKWDAWLTADETGAMCSQHGSTMYAKLDSADDFGSYFYTCTVPGCHAMGRCGA